MIVFLPRDGFVILAMLLLEVNMFASFIMMLEARRESRGAPKKRKGASK